MVVDPVEQEAGPRAGRRGMRLLGGVCPELPAPVQRNVGVWRALSLIVVVVGLDLVGGRKAQLLGLLVGPPILAASFVGPKRTLVVGLAALAAAIGYGKAVGVDLLAGSQAVARSRSGPRRCCRRWWHGCGWSGKGGCEELSAPMGRVRSWNLQGDRLIGQWGCHLTLVFDEPLEPSEGPFDGLADWYRNSGSREAQAARRDLNAWYAVFPDRHGMLLGNLQGDSDIGIEQATDELYVHHLLSRSYQARYEEDANSPDFRLYRSSEYMAGIEVLTLFPESDFVSKVSRNGALVDEINRRVRPVHWYVGIDVIDWRRQPRVAPLVRWLKRALATLPPPAASLAREDYPAAVYSGADVELAFNFLPRRKATPPTATEPIVAFGPAITEFVQPVRRLRSRLSRKIGSRYDHRGRPFAVLISARDYACDTKDIIDALYGDDAVAFRPGDPDSARPIRKHNGTFGRSASTPAGRNRRLSCVFVLMRGWAPGSTEAAKVIRFDNPFAEQPFPDDVLALTSRFVARRDDSGIHMEWEPGLPSR